MKFEEGELYYQCWAMAKDRIIISTWCFKGYKRTLGRSSSACDLSEHFYVFQEMRNEDPDHDVTLITLHIPNLAQANMSMLTFQELMATIEELRSDDAACCS